MDSLTAEDFLSLLTEVANEMFHDNLVSALRAEGLDCVLINRDDFESLTFVEMGIAIEEKIEIPFPNLVLKEVFWADFLNTKGRIKDLYDCVMGKVAIAEFA